MFRAERILVLAEEETKARPLVALLIDAGVQRINTATRVQQVKSGVDALFVLAERELVDLAASLAARILPVPFVVSVGVFGAAERLALARQGVVAHLPWPATRADVLRCFATIASAEVFLESALRLAVGRLSMREAHQCVREVMLLNALHAARGSRRGAAKILGVTRPAVQRMLREMEDPAKLEELELLLAHGTNDESAA